MAYKLKLDKDNHAVLQDGKPVYIKDDGDEIPFDANMAFNKQHQLNEENKSWRLKFEEATSQLKSLEGVDPEKFKEYAEIAEQFKESERVKNGEIEKLKQELSQTSEKKIKEVEQTWQARYNAKAEEAAKFAKQYNTTVIGNEFFGSSFIKENCAVTPRLLMAEFKSRFQIDPETNHIVALDDAGKPMLSEEKIGSIASFDEAIKLMVKNHPDRDFILKPKGQPGGGMGNNGRGMSQNDHEFFADTKVDASQKLNKIRRQSSGN